MRVGLQPVLQVAAWSCVALLAILSLLPGSELHRPTSFGGGVEHAVAYAGSAFIIARAYPRWSLQGIFAGLAVYAGILEYLQHYAPGRTPAWKDYAASVLGVAIGLVATILVRRWLDARPAPHKT